MNNKYTPVVFAVVALLVGLGLGFWYGNAKGVASEKKAQEEARLKAEAEAAAAVNPFQQASTNPFEKSPVNPYENVNINPFK